MKGTQKIRMGIDIAMTILLPLLMGYSLVGEAAHEWMGLAMGTLFIMHHLLNYRWFTRLFKGRYTPVRIFSTVVNLLLFIIVFLIPVSGIMMSRHVFPSLPIEVSTTFARQIHLVCGYWGFVLMSVHLGTHGDMMIGRIKAARKKTRGLSESRKKRFPFIQLIILAAAVYGVKAFIQRQIGTYLFLQSEFVFFDFDESRFYFFADYLAIMLLFACIGYYTIQLLRLLSKKFGRE